MSEKSDTGGAGVEVSAESEGARAIKVLEEAGFNARLSRITYSFGTVSEAMIMVYIPKYKEEPTGPDHSRE
jgi:hypothetical protein